MYKVYTIPTIINLCIIERKNADLHLIFLKN